MSAPRSGVSAYCALLTLALSANVHSQGELPALTIMRRIKPPGAVISQRVIRRLCAVAAIGVFVVFWRLNQPLPGRQVTVAAVFADVVAVFAVLTLPWLYPARRERLYSEIANLTFAFSFDETVPYVGWIVRGGRAVVDRLAFRRLDEAREELTRLRGTRVHSEVAVNETEPTKA